MPWLWIILFAAAAFNFIFAGSRRLDASKSGLGPGELAAILIVIVGMVSLVWEILGITGLDLSQYAYLLSWLALAGGLLAGAYFAVRIALAARRGQLGFGRKGYGAVVAVAVLAALAVGTLSANLAAGFVKSAFVFLTVALYVIAVGGLVGIFLCRPAVALPPVAGAQSGDADKEPVTDKAVQASPKQPHET